MLTQVDCYSIHHTTNETNLVFENNSGSFNRYIWYNETNKTCIFGQYIVYCESVQARTEHKYTITLAHSILKVVFKYTL